MDTTHVALDFDVRETGDGLLLRAPLHGLEQKDLEISLDLDRLVFRGPHGSLIRWFTLPRSYDADAIEASLDDGVLTVTIPRRPFAS